jgi:oligosaccharide repeat unit polymerase
MKNRIICNPALIFTSVWINLLLISYINSKISLLEFNYLSDYIVFVLFGLIFIWNLGYIFGYSITPFFTKFFGRIKYKSISNRKFKIIIILLLSLYFIFKILDIIKTTGVPSISPFNIGAYRYALTELGLPSSYNFINILNPILFGLPSIIYFLHKNDINCGVTTKIILFIFYLMFIYLSSARSAAFVSIIILFFVLAYNDVKLRYLLLFPFLLFILFGLIGSIVGKPGFEPFLVYLLAPLHAFDIILNSGIDFSYDLLSFRPFHGLFLSFGLLDNAAQYLDYIETPYPVNVYTVFGVYYFDFGLFGLLVAMFIFSLFSTILHLIACKVKSFKFHLLSSFYLSFIVLGVFYDYYTSSMFSFLAPVLIFTLVPSKYLVDSSTKCNFE